LSVAIRLCRVGRRHRPIYHIAAFDVRTRRDGRPVETLGHFDPEAKGEAVRVDLERVRHWLSVGASPSGTVASILKKQGLDSSLWRRKPVKRTKPKADPTKADAAKAKKVAPAKKKKKRTANSKDRKARKTAKS
jgi:small subunit ribosomal protein S16